jgi:predicted nucleic acid-binding protein
MAAAIHLAQAKGLRINDALIAQQVMDEHAALLTDNVRHFRKIGM